MELKDVFGEIESDGADLVHGRLLEWALTPPLWHADAVGGVHTIRPRRTTCRPTWPARDHPPGGAAGLARFEGDTPCYLPLILNSSRLSSIRSSAMAGS